MQETSSQLRQGRPRSYRKVSQTIKQRLIRLYLEGQKIKEAARFCGIGYSNAKKIVKKYKQEQSQLQREASQRHPQPPFYPPPTQETRINEATIEQTAGATPVPTLYHHYPYWMVFSQPICYLTLFAEND